MSYEDDDDDLKFFEQLGSGDEDADDTPAEDDLAEGVSLVGDVEAMQGKIKYIRNAHGRWDVINQRTNRALYSLLGGVYAACPLVIGLARDELIREVRKHEDVGKSNVWDPYQKSAISLFLTMLLGLKNQKATKSQWKKLLMAAVEAKVERTEQAFVKWVIQQKGINGIYARANSDLDAGSLRTAKMATLVKELDINVDPDHPDPQYTIAAPAIPEPIGEGEFPQGLALIIVRRAKGGFESLHTITNATLIIKALRAWQWEVDRFKQHMDALARQRVEAFDKMMNQLWREYVKKHGTNGYDKGEFIEERREEVQALVDEGF